MTEQTQPTDAELLPCPFCEGRARMKTVASDWWKIVIDHAEGCVLSGHYDDAIVPQDDESKDWLIDRWNTRAKWGTPAGAGEVVGWMWQHEETGRTGFVDCWQVENGWQENNPRLRLVSKLFTTPQPTQAQAGAVPLTVEQLYEERQTAIPQLFDLAQQWADNKIHSYQFANEAEKIVDAVARRVESAHGIKGADHG